MFLQIVRTSFEVSLQLVHVSSWDFAVPAADMLFPLENHAQKVGYLEESRVMKDAPNVFQAPGSLQGLLSLVSGRPSSWSWGVHLGWFCGSPTRLQTVT